MPPGRITSSLAPPSSYVNAGILFLQRKKVGRSYHLFQGLEQLLPLLNEPLLRIQEHLKGRFIQQVLTNTFDGLVLRVVRSSLIGSGEYP